METLEFTVTEYWDMTPEQKAEAAALKKRVEIQEHVRFWGSEYDITPAFVAAFFGDGKQLVAITPLNTRPNYYVIRVDSSWNLSNFQDEPIMGDYIDEIYDAIEAEYGCMDDRDEEDETPEEERGWPMLNSECGSSWSSFTLSAG